MLGESVALHPSQTGQQSISQRHHVHSRLLAEGGKTNDVGKDPIPLDKRGNFVLLGVFGEKLRSSA